ncbi:MAG: hypothetical protein Ct9H300mP19_07890 [Dehalococcoidia bacterium]|nr:MAG: hypothetical protein Ct9H300mP19_07890 [Dehalococcoidia bacterium]
MTKLAANISMMFTEVDFLDRFEVAAKAGFKGLNISSHTITRLIRLKKNLIKTVSTGALDFQQVIGMRVTGIGALPDRQENFKMELEWV